VKEDMSLLATNADRRGTMDIFFPPQTLSLLQVFAPCFTGPSFAYFQSDMWALMVVEGRKCMARLAGCVFFHQRGLSSWERFLAEHRWSVTAVTARLLRLVVERLGEQLKVHGAYLRGKDTTLVAKSAKRMLGVQKWKDPSDNADRGTYMVGHHWNLVGLSSPWGTRWLCWPLVMRLVPGLTGARQWIVGDTVELMTFWDAAIAAILEVTPQLGDAAVRVVADAYDSKAPFLQGLLARGIDVISRLRKDAVGWEDPAPPPPGKRGPKPRHGRKWTLATLLTAETPVREHLTLYGTLTEVVFVVRDVWLREVAHQGRGGGLAGAKEPIILVSTDLALSALQLDRELRGALLDRADDPRFETTFRLGRLPVYHHAGHPAFCAPGLYGLLLVAAGSHRQPHSRLAPGDLVAGGPAGSPPELPAGPPGLAGLGDAADQFCQVRSRGGLGKNRAGS
jgi:DDE superfamily endonuclease